MRMRRTPPLPARAEITNGRTARPPLGPPTGRVPRIRSSRWRCAAASPSAPAGRQDRNSHGSEHFRLKLHEMLQPGQNVSSKIAPHVNSLDSATCILDVFKTRVVMDFCMLPIHDLELFCGFPKIARPCARCLWNRRMWIAHKCVYRAEIRMDPIVFASNPRKFGAW